MKNFFNFLVGFVGTLVIAALAGWLWVALTHFRPSSEWEAQPHADLMVCGKRLQLLSRNAAEELSWQIEQAIKEEYSKKLEYSAVQIAGGVDCHISTVWYTPGTWSEFQTDWGQGVTLPDSLANKMRATRWFRNWWDW